MGDDCGDLTVGAGESGVEDELEWKEQSGGTLRRARTSVSQVLGVDDRHWNAGHRYGEGEMN